MIFITDTMTKVLEAKLRKKFSQLYADLYRHNTLMQWGIACDDGWYDLIYNLSSELQAWSDCKQIPIVALQVKEKFGTLRYYISRVEGGSRAWTAEECKEVLSIVDKYQKLSATTCELTGNVGRIRIKDNWFKTLCDESACLLGYTGEVKI